MHNFNEPMKPLDPSNETLILNKHENKNGAKLAPKNLPILLVDFEMEVKTHLWIDFSVE